MVSKHVLLGVVAGVVCVVALTGCLRFRRTRRCGSAEDNPPPQMSHSSPALSAMLIAIYSGCRCIAI